MLSIRDLLDAGTLNQKMAAYLLAAISSGMSFLVGAKPGGAGKTTVMAALLNFIPEMTIVPTENSQVIREGLKEVEPKCFLAHEIGHGRWYAYIWDGDVEDFLRLTRHHMVAGNLHADDIDDVLNTPGIGEDNLASLDLLVFMRMIRGSSGVKRRISSVCENQGGRGRKAFQPVYRWLEARDLFQEIERPAAVSEGRVAWAERVLGGVIERDLRTLEEVRSYVLDNLDGAPA